MYIPNFLFSSIITTQLLSTCLKTEFHLLPVSEMGQPHTLALNFSGWPFSITVRRCFKPKSDHWNERIHCRLTDRKLETFSKEESGSTYPSTFVYRRFSHKIQFLYCLFSSLSPWGIPLVVYLFIWFIILSR